MENIVAGLLCFCLLAGSGVLEHVEVKSLAQ